MAEQFHEHYLKHLRYSAETGFESVYALQFDFGRGILSPPQDTYNENPLSKLSIENKHVSRVEFENYRDSGHAWLHGLKFFDEFGEIMF